KPDLVLLDVHLPDANGFDLCRRLKADPATAAVPVLLISAISVSTDDRVRGLDIGADGYLTKPVEPAEVLAQVKALLRLRQAEEATYRLAAIVAGSDDAIYSESLDGAITSWNPGAERLYGYTAEEVLGKPVSMLSPPDRQGEMEAILD